MVWDFFSGVGLDPIVPVRGILNASACQGIVVIFIIQTLWELIVDGSFLFQHDCTPVHKAKPSQKSWSLQKQYSILTQALVKAITIAVNIDRPKTSFLTSVFKEPQAANPGAPGSNFHEPRRSLHGSNCVRLE